MSTRPDDEAQLALRVRGLTRRFGPVLALDGVDLSVATGSFYALVGPNGAGKSTTVRVLSGLIARDAGEVRVLGLDPAEAQRALAARIGLVPDFPALFEELSPRQNIHRLSALRGLASPLVAERLEELAAPLGLAGHLDEPVRGLSHGTRKKATLAAALLHAPPLLFLDEPFEGLDPLSVHALRAMLDELRSRGVTILLTSHVLPLVETLASHVGILDEGRLVASGPLSEIVGRHGTLEEALIEEVGREIVLPDLSWYAP